MRIVACSLSLIACGSNLMTVGDAPVGDSAARLNRSGVPTSIIAGRAFHSWDGRLSIHPVIGPDGMGVTLFRAERLQTRAGVPVLDDAELWSPPAMLIASPIQSPFEERTDAEITAALAQVRAMGIDGFSVQAVAPLPLPHSNPYRSTSDGTADDSGAFETYKLIVFCVRGFAPVPRRVPQEFIFPTPATTAFLATVVVADPKTVNARPIRATVDSPVTPLTTTNGNFLQGFEVSATADGRLLILHSIFVSRILYSFNRTLSATGWSEPRPLTMLHEDRDVLIDGIRLADRYPLAAQPLRRPDGSLYQPGEDYQGAYPWITLDGSELFHPAALGGEGSPNPSLRVRNSIITGLAVIGRWTGWTLKHIDGPLNPDRRASSPTVLTQRGSVSSPGQFPSMWAPFAEVPHVPLPYTHARPVIPIVNGLALTGYMEVPFDDHEDGNYLLYLSMNEMLNARFRFPLDTSAVPRLDGYTLDRTADTSGHFNTAFLRDGAAFPYEYNRVDESPGIVGRAVYFPERGVVGALPSPSLDAIASTFTAQLFVKRLVDLSSEPGSHHLFTRRGSYELVLDKSGALRGRVNVGGTWVALGPSAAQVPAGTWAHVALRVDARAGRADLLLDAQSVAAATFASGTVASSSEPLLIGPAGLTGASPNIPPSQAVLLIDEVSLSDVARDETELQKSAFQYVKRPAPAWTLPLPLGLRAEGLSSPSPSPAAIELGKLLFFEPRLSGDGTVSCATCHKPELAFTDGLALGRGRQGATLARNTQTVFNRAFSARQFWDGRASSLEEQAVQPIVNPQEMGGSIPQAVAFLASSPTYTQRFLAAFGAGPNEQTLKEALAAFQRSLLTGDSRYDRALTGQNALTDSERRGRGLFFGKARCVACHRGQNFTDEEFHRLGFFEGAGAPEGRGAVTGRAKDARAFKTPTLRNVALTAPYFHDGSAATLAGVVDLYNRGAPGVAQKDAQIQPLGLSAAEQADLVAFLGALTGNEPAVQPPTLPTDGTVPVPTSGAFTQVTGCVVSPGATTCPVQLQWTAQNAPLAGVRARLLGSGSSGLVCTATGPCSFSAGAGRWELTLHQEGANPASALLDRREVEVLPDTSPRGELTQLTGCTIAPLTGSCAVTLAWRATHAPLAGLRARPVGTGATSAICATSPCTIAAPAGEYEVLLHAVQSDAGSPVLATGRVSVAPPAALSLASAQVVAGPTLVLRGAGIGAGALLDYRTASGAVGTVATTVVSDVEARVNTAGAPPGNYDVRLRNADGAASNVLSISL